MKTMRLLKMGLTLGLFLLCLGTNAQTSDSCIAKAPSEVAAGQPFQYTVTTFAQGDIVSADFGKFDIQGGPSVGTNTSITMTNGHVEQKTTYTYTYSLSCDREGSFSIPGVTISIDGKLLKSNFVIVKVVKTAKLPSYEPDRDFDSWFQMPQMPHIPQMPRWSPWMPQNSEADTEQEKGKADKFDKDDIFVKTTTSQWEAYQGEPVIVTHKLYLKSGITSYNIRQASMSPSESLWMDDLDLTYNTQRGTETINGKTYSVITVRQTAVYPRKTGKITIPKLHLTLVVGIPTTVNDPFWGKISTYKNKEVKLESNELTLKIRALPGAHSTEKTEVIGNFTMSSSLNRSNLHTNEAATLMITVTGNGNLHHIEAKDIDIVFPADWDVTNPRIIDHISAKGDIITGSRTFKYTLIPRSEGTFLIPAATYTYFNLETETHKTITAQGYELTVTKGRRTEPDTSNSKLPKNVKLYKVSKPILPDCRPAIPVKAELPTKPENRLCTESGTELALLSFTPAQHLVTASIMPSLCIYSATTWIILSVVFFFTLIISLIGILLTPLRWLRILCWTGLGIGSLMVLFPIIFAVQITRNIHPDRENVHIVQPLEVDATTCSAKAPDTVSVGESFPYTITINGKGKVKETHFDDFDMTGRSSSNSQSSLSIINGKTCKTGTTEYTYYLFCNKAGVYIIPPCTLQSGKKVLTTNPVKITVSDTKPQSDGI